MGKLTVKAVENAKPRSSEYSLSDGDGLYLRLRHSGERSWVFRYRRPSTGKPAKLTLGSFPALSMASVRDDLAGLRALVAKGIDPKQARAAEVAKNAAVSDMNELFKSWIDVYRHTPSRGRLPSEPTVKAHQWRWHKYLAKALGDIRLPDIQRAHLAKALDAMRSHTRVETGKALTTLRFMLDHAVSRHMIDENPARMLRPADFGASQSAPKERALSIEELRQLWFALNTHQRIALVTATAIKLLILTGARRAEVSAMSWKELDLDAGVWTLPKERTKNKKGHVVYLPKLAIELLEELKPYTEHAGWVFASSVDPKYSIHVDSLTTAVQRLQGRGRKDRNMGAPLSKVEAFTVHDLRRSAATCWAENLKVPPHIIERMLNHLPADKLIATYQRAAYVEEQRTAWKVWGELVATRVARHKDQD